MTSLPSEDDIALWREALLTNEGALARLEQLRGWHREAVKALGLGLDGRRIVFPIRDENGSLLNCVRYAPNPEGRGSGPKTVALGGHPRGLFPAPETLTDGDEPVLLVEGEPDAVAGLSLGFRTVAVSGVQGWRREWTTRFQRFPSVVVCFDCDNPGREKAEEVARDLSEVLDDVRNLDLGPHRDDGYDLGDIARAATTADERARAKEWLRTSIAATPNLVEPLWVHANGFLEHEDDEQPGELLLGTEKHPLIPAGGLVLIAGPYGSGKTILALDLAMHLAFQREWLGFPVSRPLRVALIENEGAKEEFKKTYGRLRRERWTGEMGGKLFIQTWRWGDFSFADPGSYAMAKRYIERDQIDVVIGDPLELLGPEGVGSPDDTRKFIQLLPELGLRRRTAFVFLHHFVQGSSRRQKASRLDDEISGAWGKHADCVLILQQEGKDRARLDITKIRLHSLPPPMILRHLDPPGYEVVTVIASEEGERDLEGEVLKLLSDGEWRKLREIAVEDEGGVGASMDKVKAVLDALVEADELETTRDRSVHGRPTSARCWRLRRSERLV